MLVGSWAEEEDHQQYRDDKHDEADSQRLPELDDMLALRGGLPAGSAHNITDGAAHEHQEAEERKEDQNASRQGRAERSHPGCGFGCCTALGGDRGCARRAGSGSRGGKQGQCRQHTNHEGLAWIGVLQSTFDKSQHLLVQQLASAREALPDRILGQIQRCGDSFHGLMLAVEQDQRLAIDLRHALDGAPENGFLLLADCAFRRQRFGRRGILGRLEGLGSVDRLVSIPAQRLAD